MEPPSSRPRQNHVIAGKDGRSVGSFCLGRAFWRYCDREPVMPNMFSTKFCAFCFCGRDDRSFVVVPGKEGKRAAGQTRGERAGGEKVQHKKKKGERGNERGLRAGERHRNTENEQPTALRIFEIKKILLTLFTKRKKIGCSLSAYQFYTSVDMPDPHEVLYPFATFGSLSSVFVNLEPRVFSSERLLRVKGLHWAEKKVVVRWHHALFRGDFRRSRDTKDGFNLFIKCWKALRARCRKPAKPHAS